MNAIERYQHELHSRLPAFKRKVEQARAIVNEVYDQTQEDFYCAFSGGIDSTVLLDLLLQEERVDPKDIVWGDDGWDFPETLAFLKATEDRYWFALRRIRCLQPWRDWCLEMGRPDLSDDPQAWGNPHIWNATWDSLKDAHQHGYGGVFLGMLAGESRARRLVLKNGTRHTYQVAEEGGMWHCSPLASWTKQDVWAYAVSRDLAYNPVYDRLADLGIPLERRRVAPLTCFRVLQYGSAAHLKAGWPDLLNRLSILFPEVRASV